MVLSVLGVVLAFIALIYLTYKGAHLAYVTVLAVFIIMITSGMPIIDTWTNKAMSGVSNIAGTLLPLYLAGAIFGRILSDSGAADSFAQGLLSATTKRVSPATARLFGALIIIGLGILMGVGGVDNFAILFTEIAIAASIMKTVNIPRRFLPVLIMLGTTTCALLPGAPSMINIIVAPIVGSTPTAAPIPALAGAVIMLSLSVFSLSKLWEKDVASGINFEYGPLKPARFDEKHLPPPYLLPIPVIIIFAAYNLLKLPAFFSLLIGLVISIILFFNYLPIEEGESNKLIAKFRALLNAMNYGTEIAGMGAIIVLTLIIGFVVGETQAFKGLVTLCSNIKGPALIVFAVAAVLIVGISASMSGLIITANVAKELFIPVLGISAGAAHRIIGASSTVLDSLPFGTMVVMLLILTGIKHKEGYPPIFIATVAYTFLGLVVTTILCMIPGLA
ncbi:hypothetical protein M2651_09230 [Clostridium sp. SYSU_GA19001]|uniref:hypothetical protein n=1 Tax=Clostridium caldaquaticum TaxID=2940653 RepID=UPI002076DACB|nr:hypothetical protein [Clostridium caldaquaticum]MCM8711210.1 hypothetical protein [Clostridium caldaquaticum]